MKEEGRPETVANITLEIMQNSMINQIKSNQLYLSFVISGCFTCGAGLDYALMSQLFPLRGSTEATVAGRR